MVSCFATPVKRYNRYGSLIHCARPAIMLPPSCQKSRHRPRSGTWARSVLDIAVEPMSIPEREHAALFPPQVTGSLCYPDNGVHHKLSDESPQKAIACYEFGHRRAKLVVQGDK